MNHLREYRVFKFWPTKANVKDTEEPFFIEPKYDYKRKKSIYGSNDYKDIKRIKVDEEVLDKLQKSRDVSHKLWKILEKIKKYTIEYKRCMDNPKIEDFPDNYVVYGDLNRDDAKKLMEFGFGLKIYDDSNEYSDYFGDKYKISWEYKKPERRINEQDPLGEENW
jgi:hypothetical protein